MTQISSQRHVTTSYLIDSFVNFDLCARAVMSRPGVSLLNAAPLTGGLSVKTVSVLISSRCYQANKFSFRRQKF